jgi:hypothetical protein
MKNLQDKFKASFLSIIISGVFSLVLFGMHLCNSSAQTFLHKFSDASAFVVFGVGYLFACLYDDVKFIYRVLGTTLCLVYLLLFTGYEMGFESIYSDVMCFGFNNITIYSIFIFFGAVAAITKLLRNKH